MTDGNTRWSVAATLAAVAVTLLAIATRHWTLVADDVTRPGHDWNDIHEVDALLVQRAWDEGALLPWFARDLQGGTSLYAVPTKAFSYPPFLVAVAAAGPILGFNLLVVTHALFGALALLWVLRRLGFHPAAAVCGSVLFALGIYPGSLFISAPYWGYALAWWPFCLLATIELLRGRRPVRAGILLGICLAMQVHAGGIFPLYWLACLLTLLAVPWLCSLRFWRDRGGTRVLAAMGAAVCFAGLAAVKLLPVLRWVATTGRGGALSDEDIFFTYERFDAKGAGRGPLGILHTMLFVEDRPGVWFLLAMLPLGIAACVAGRHRTLARGALLGLAFCVLVATGVAHHALYALLPGYDRMRMPYRFLFPAGMAAVLLAACGIDLAQAWLASRRPALARAARPVAGVLALLALLAVNGVPIGPSHAAMVASRSDLLRVARPVYHALLEDPRPSRIHGDRAGEQSVWVPLGVDTTTGLLGGDGSANAAYEEFLPFRESADTLARDHPHRLDVLNVRYLASMKQSTLPGLEQLQAPRSAADLRERRVPAPNAFAARIRADGAGLDFCGYIGGFDQEIAYGVAVDPGGEPVVAGLSGSGDGSFAQPGGDATLNGPTDAFLCALTRDGAHVAASTLFGGAGEDWCLDVDVAPDGRRLVAGRTRLAWRAWDAFFAALPAPSTAPVPSPTAAARPATDALRLPLAFVENGGQFAPSVAFVLQNPGTVMYAQDDGLTFLQVVQEGTSRAHWALRLAFAGARPTRPAGAAPLPWRRHELHGPEPRFARDVRVWSAIRYDEIWPGVALEVRGNGDQLVLRFEVGPEGDPGAIRLHPEGQTRGGLVAGEGLRIESVLGALVVAPPRAFSTRDGDADRELPALLAAAPHDTVCFDVGADPTSDGTLERAARVIEARIELPRGGLGGAWDDFAKAVVAAPDGGAFVAGSTSSSRPPPPPAPGGCLAGYEPDSDGFVARFDAAGRLEWLTTLGGDQPDFIQSIALDAAGRPHVTGSTRSDAASFPVRVGPGLTYGGDEDAFVARLAADGRSLEYCGYVGGARGDYGQGVAVDARGCAVLCGDTKSDETTFPVRGGPDLTFNGLADVYVARVAADGSRFESCGYVGGDGLDVPYGLALDGAGNIHVPGTTSSTEATFPVTSGPALRHAPDKWDGFVVKVNRDCMSLEYCGFLGGDDVDRVQCVAIDPEGRAVVAGLTVSDERSFPVRVGPETSFGADPYAEYLRGVGSLPHLKPYERPFLYRRDTCLERVSYAARPVWIVGDPARSHEAALAAVDAEGFDARRTVVVEVEDPAGLPEQPGAAAMVLLAGAPADGTDARALEQRTGARVATLPQDSGRALGTVAGSFPDCGIEPVPAGGVDGRLSSLRVDLEGAPQHGVLLLSETFTMHPGWHAELDGDSVPILRADGGISAIRLRPGARAATFTFRPPGWIAGAVVTGTTLAVLLALALRRMRESRGVRA